MHPLTRELATRHASEDGEPRLVVHGPTIWLVTPDGEIWQVFDSDGREGEVRGHPLNDDRVNARIFVRTDIAEMVRIYRFGLDEARSAGARHLFQQLHRAKSGDEMAYYPAGDAPRRIVHGPTPQPNL